MNVDELKSLRERVGAATGPDYSMHDEIALALSCEHQFTQLAGAPEGAGCMMYRYREGGQWESALRVTHSVDASIALAQRMLPGCFIEVSGPRKYLNIPTPVPNVWLATLLPDRSQDRRGWGANGALALLDALLSALIAQAEAP